MKHISSSRSHLMIKSACRVAVAMLLLPLAGCQPSTDVASVVVPPEQLDAYRVKFQAAEEPDTSLGIIELRESFPDADIPDPPVEPDPADETNAAIPVDYSQVVVVGKVGGKCPQEVDSTDFPIVQDEAVFYIVDPAFEIDAVHDHGEDHDCPFCNKQAVEAQAIVRMLGDDGKPLPVCAKALLDLEEEALVVVTGAAEVQLDTLVITAQKVFIRR
jgi:hypothetical protein